MNDEERLLAYLDGRLAEGERRELEARLLEDEALASQLYEELGTSHLLALGVAPRRRRPARRAIAWAVPLAAAAVLLLLFLPRGGVDPTAPVLRGQGGTLQLWSPPAGPATPPLEFRWSPVEGAANYVLELYDADGRRVFRGTTADTTSTPEALPPTGGTGFWWVEAQGADAAPLARSEARALDLRAPREVVD